jgi:hypothetical protein
MYSRGYKNEVVQENKKAGLLRTPLVFPKGKE